MSTGSKAGAMDPDPSRDLDPTPDEFRRLGARVVEEIATYLETVRERPVITPHAARDVETAFDEPLPMKGGDADAILDVWREKLVPDAAHLGSPRWFGFVMGSGAPVGVLADALSSALNLNVGTWKGGPSGTAMERRVIAWLAEMIGYPADARGILTSGGTMANLVCLRAALRWKAGDSLVENGLQGEDHRYVLYMSDHEGHVSILRVADVLGLGRAAVRRVPSREDLTMDPDALRDMVRADREAGDVPFAVVAQVGSINVGVVDPLDELADVCDAEDLWLHADGACGAVGAMLPELEEAYRGLDRADSVTLDPHKWLYVNYECGCALVRDGHRLHRSFSLSAPYLRGALDTEHEGVIFGEWGAQMSRGFRAYKVYANLRYYGVEGYQRLLRNDVRCARRVAGLAREDPDFEALHDPLLYIVSFRYAPRDLQAELSDAPPQRREAIQAYLDRLNQRVADEIQLSGDAFIMTTSLRDRRVLRMSICSHRATVADMDRVFEKLGELGAEIDRAERSDHLPSAS